MDTPKTCKVCSPEHKTGCQLAHAVCPYRDVDTLDLVEWVESLDE